MPVSAPIGPLGRWFPESTWENEGLCSRMHRNLEMGVIDVAQRVGQINVNSDGLSRCGQREETCTTDEE